MPAGDKELSLPFESQPSGAENGSVEKLSSRRPLVQESDSDPVHDDDNWSIQETPRDAKEEFIVPPDEPSIRSPRKIEIEKDFADDDPFFSKTSAHESAEDPDNILPISSYIDQRASILPFVSLFCLLIIGFALFSVIAYANPQRSEAIIKAIPLLGPAALRNNHLREGIVVQSLRSSYQTIQGNRDVFLISGVAINQNPEVVREIQLSGITYTAEGKEIERQTIWAGNTISPKIIRGMTIEDIPHLQDLKPLKTFELPPGDSIPFTIVFLKSAKNAKTFSYEVLAAEGRD
jgi:hypothetical protein